jgi:hypothetical protein
VGHLATLNMIFSATYYLELHNVLIFYCTSPFSTNKGQIGCLNIIELKHDLYLVKKLCHSK